MICIEEICRALQGVQVQLGGEITNDVRPVEPNTGVFGSEAAGVSQALEGVSSALGSAQAEKAALSRSIAQYIQELRK